MVECTTCGKALGKRNRTGYCAKCVQPALGPTWGGRTATLFPPFSMDALIACAVRFTGMSREHVLGISRKSARVAVRAAIMVEAYRRGRSQPQIAKVFGLDHTSVCHAILMLPVYCERNSFVPALCAALAEVPSGPPIYETVKPAKPPRPGNLKPMLRVRPQPVDRDDIERQDDNLAFEMRVASDNLRDAILQARGA